jgi:hypothetical protein
MGDDKNAGVGSVYQFVNGPRPVEPSQPLWRYVNVPNLLLYLSGKLRLTSIGHLQRMDPLEGHAIWDEVVQMDAFIQDSEQLNYRALEDYYRERCLNESARQCFDSNAEQGHSNQGEVFRWWRERLLKTRYSLCLFAARHESMAMWDLYAKQGFAIRTTAARLEKALEPTGRAWLLSRMIYFDKSEEVGVADMDCHPNFVDGLRRPFLLKSKEYEFEKEVRLVTVDPKKQGSLTVEDVKPKEWIDQVLISPRIWGPDAEALRSMIEEKAPWLKGKVGQSRTTRLPGSGGTDYDEGPDQEEEAKHWPTFLWEP